MSKAFIGLTKDGKYIVLSREGKPLSGPFVSSDEAVTARSDMGMAGVQLGVPGISESKTEGFEGYVICVDGMPYVRFRDLQDAKAVLRSFELGVTALIYKRFLGGLGDMIALSGAAVRLSQIHGKISLASTNQYEHEFKRIFVDYPNITLNVALPSPDRFFSSPICDDLLLHNETVALVDTHLDHYERVYKTFGIPYSYRWEACPVNSACDRVDQIKVPNGEYIFLHDDSHRGFGICRFGFTDIPVHHPSSFSSNTILSFKDMIENATEVHVFDSCFFHLTESINPKGKLFFHKVKPHVKRYNDYKTRHKWNIVD